MMLAYGFTPEEARELKAIANRQRREKHQRMLLAQASIAQLAAKQQLDTAIRAAERAARDAMYEARKLERDRYDF